MKIYGQFIKESAQYWIDKLLKVSSAFFVLYRAPVDTPLSAGSAMQLVRRQRRLWGMRKRAVPKEKFYIPLWGMPAV